MQNNLDRAVATYSAMQESMYVTDGDGALCIARRRPRAGQCTPTCGRFRVRSSARWLWRARPVEPRTPQRYTTASLDSSATGTGSRGHQPTRRQYPGFFGGGGDKYYDDNAWVSLALIQRHRMGLDSSLRRAEQVWKFAQKGWDHSSGADDPRLESSGSSNAPAPGSAITIAAPARLLVTQSWGFTCASSPAIAAYEGDSEPVARPRSVGALTMVNWGARHVDRSGTGEGPFWNVARADGSIDRNVWSYNQGVMIGARVLQFRLSSDAAFLRLAERIARQTLATFGDFTLHPPSFNAMCFQNMLMLCAESQDADLRRTYAM